ncbi:Undecaprenyl-phosphate glucose phosphotransferase [Acidobacteriia bacterium SbA2]|nr:Undecaprenyl-phosphate glucose phosphotransferase [Acidobacteriia bacterium SbA2]
MISLLNRTVFNFRLLTLFLPLLSFLIAGAVEWQHIVSSDIDPYPYFGLLTFATIAWSIAIESYGLCTTKYILMSGGNVYAALLATLMTLFAELVIMFFYRATSFSRLFVASSAVVLFFSAVGLRFLLRAAMKGRLLRKSGSVRVLIVGADEFAERTARSLVDREFKGVEIAGFVRLQGQNAKVKGIVCDLDSIGDIVAGNRIDDVVLALPAPRLHELPTILEKVQHFGAPVRAVLDLGDQPPTSDRLLNVNGVWMVNVCHTPTESIMYMIMKRGFDIAFSTAVLLFTAPLMAVIAVAVKLTSPGPVLFAQNRVGFRGNVFKMYKFRTMRTSNTAEGDQRWTSPDDSRRTRVGTLLRRSSLDELPQFFNVLKGDMSVVGPRPERPYFVEKFAVEVPRYRARHYLKVGITGWAQVNGWRGDTSIEKRVEHDLYYLNNWSLLFDLRIVLRTVLHTLNAKHAY